MRTPPPKHALFAILSIAVLASTVVEMATPTAAAAAPGQPVVYLTFDDGPGPSTPAFLDLLARYDIKGTFFMTGRAITANPETARRVAAERHGVANHTWNHPRLTSLSDEAIRTEFATTTALIGQTTGLTPTCYRPPYGSTDSRVHGNAVALGLTNEAWATGGADAHWGLWDIDTNDWRLNLRSGWSEAAMMRELNKASNGDTILMHDGFSRRTRGLAVLTDWLAANHDRFDFQVLPGCSGRPTEPELDHDAPQAWHRFQIARLYRAYFDRRPDSEGWEYWNREFAVGSSLADISYSFAQSSEFNRTATLNDEQFVTFVYAAVLDREPDADGFAYWLDQLAGDTDRGELVLYFSESEEYITRTAQELTGDCFDGTVVGSYRCWAEILPSYDW
ncbi:MAG: polysaccharide deacetylase family protein [Acidimicrobiales bacterium]